MALPDVDLPVRDFIKDLTYFEAALLEADLTAELSKRITAQVRSLIAKDGAAFELDLQEMRARRRRDRVDSDGDRLLRQWRDELAAFSRPGTFALDTVFPDGIKSVVNVVGERQIEQLEALGKRIATARSSPRLADMDRADRIAQLLEQGAQLVTEQLGLMQAAVAAWAQADRSARDEADGVRHAKEKAREEASAVLGALRDLLKGDTEAASSYTKPGPQRSRKQASAPTPAEPAPPA